MAKPKRKKRTRRQKKQETISYVPYICYEGEEFAPARNQYVIWYRVHKLLGNTMVDPHLAYTGNDGRLHPLGDSFINPNANKVTFDKINNDYVFTIHNFKHWFDVKKDSASFYDQAVRFNEGEFVGLFFVSQSQTGFQFSSKYLTKNNLVRADKVKIRNSKTRRLAPGEKFWVPLPASYPLYLYRLRKLIKEANKRIKAANTRLGSLIACASFADQAGNLVSARGRRSYLHWRLKTLKDRKGLSLAPLAYAESKMLQWHFVEELRSYIKRTFKKASQVAETRIHEVTSELARLLDSDKHKQAFETYHKRWLEKDKNISLGVRMSYIHAYSLLSRTPYGPDLYKSHFGALLDKCKTKDKGKIGSAIADVAKKTGWVRTFRGEIYAVVQAYGSLTLSENLTDMRDDLIKASRFLEYHGIAHKIDELEDKLNKSIIHNIQVNASDYIDTPKASIGFKAFSGIVSGLKIASVMTKDHKNLAEKIESANSVVGVGLEIANIKAIKDSVPGSVVVGKAGGVITSSVDWGLSIHKMYTDAGSGDGVQFYTSVASYGGKGIVLGGTVLLLTPLAPLGLALMAIGTAIDLISDVVAYVLNWESAELEEFNKIFKQMEKVDKKRIVYGYYEGLLATRIGQTQYYKRLMKGEDLTKSEKEMLKKAIEEEWNTESGTPRFKDFIKKYFNTYTWGILDGLYSQID